MSLHPYYLDCAGRQLFACYYEPQQFSNKAVLLLYPTGQEYMRWHRPYHQMALTLAARGFHVLKFDYSGTGDSAAELQDVTLNDWITEIGFAREELAAVSGVAAPQVFASRLSCLLAAQAAALVPGAQRHIWLDPVLDGSEYLAQLRAQQKQILNDLNRFAWRRGRDYSADEIAGFAYAPEFLRQLAAMRLDELAEGLAPSVLLSVGQGFAAHAAALEVPVQALSIDYGWDDYDKLETVAQAAELQDSVAKIAAA